jgi:hypothetical protein
MAWLDAMIPMIMIQYPFSLVARPPVVLIEYAALHSVIEKKVRRNK